MAPAIKLGGGDRQARYLKPRGRGETSLDLVLALALLERLSAAVQDLAGMFPYAARLQDVLRFLGSLAVLQRTREVGEGLGSLILAIFAMAIGNDDLLRVSTNHEIRIVTDHQDLPFRLPFDEIRHDVLVD